MDRSSLVLALMLAAGVPSAYVGPERHELFAQRSSPKRDVLFQYYRPSQARLWQARSSQNNLTPYVHKCCPQGQVYHDHDCIIVNVNSIPAFQVPMLVNVSEIVSYEASEFLILFPRKTCKRNSFLLEPSKDQNDSFKITRTGQLVSLLDKNNDASPEQYCLEQFKNHNYNVMAIVCEREGPS